jgi:phage terminase small subunit
VVLERPLNQRASEESLTPRQQTFVGEYLISLNATEAAIKAGYSRRSAHVTASRLMKACHVRDAIARGRAEAAIRAAITADIVIEQLCKIAFADVRQFFRPDGSLKAVSELDEDTAAAIASFEIGESRKSAKPATRVTRIKLVDQLAALHRLGQHLGMFDDRERHLPKSKAEGLAIPTVDRVQAEVI